MVHQFTDVYYDPYQSYPFCLRFQLPWLRLISCPWIFYRALTTLRLPLGDPKCEFQMPEWGLKFVKYFFSLCGEWSHVESRRQTIPSIFCTLQAARTSVPIPTERKQRRTTVVSGRDQCKQRVQSRFQVGLNPITYNQISEIAWMVIITYWHLDEIDATFFKFKLLDCPTIVRVIYSVIVRVIWWRSDRSRQKYSAYWPTISNGTRCGRFRIGRFGGRIQVRADRCRHNNIRKCKIKQRIQEQHPFMNNDWVSASRTQVKRIPHNLIISAAGEKETSSGGSSKRNGKFIVAAPTEKPFRRIVFVMYTALTSEPKVTNWDRSAVNVGTRSTSTVSGFPPSQSKLQIHCLGSNYLSWQRFGLDTHS